MAALECRVRLHVYAALHSCGPQHADPRVRRDVRDQSAQFDAFGDGRQSLVQRLALDVPGDRRARRTRVVPHHRRLHVRCTGSATICRPRNGELVVPVPVTSRPRLRPSLLGGTFSHVATIVIVIPQLNIQEYGA